MHLQTTSVILVILGICLAAKVKTQWANQEEYNSFLGLIDNQNVKDEARENEYFYRPNPEDVPGYKFDRHGQAYVKCYNGSSTDDSHRCKMRSANYKPACAYTYDYANDEKHHSCYDIETGDNDTCNDECILKVTQHYSEETRIPSLIGFCCCTTEQCNNQSQAQLTRALEKYNRDHSSQHHHHHHHPKSTQQSRRFLEPIRQL